jgi:hypothetical protein
MRVPTGSQPTPGAFAKAISAEVRSAMARQRVSGAELARMIGRSQNYLARRLRDDVPLSANDIEDICEVLGQDLPELVIAAAHAIET